MNESALPALDDSLSAPTVCLDEKEGRIQLHIDPALSGPEIETAVRLLLDTRPDLRNRGVQLEFSDREVALFDLRKLTRLLAADYGLTVASVGVTERALVRFAQAELKVRLQVRGSERSWTVETARPLPMAPAHRLVPAACAAGVVPASEAVVTSFAQLDCGEGIPAPEAKRSAACAADDTEAVEAAPASPVRRAASPDGEPAAGTLGAEAPNASSARVAAAGSAGLLQGSAVIAAAEAGGNRVHALYRTLRSGVTVRHNGDLIVFGDVNAGAQVVADGNIVVLGSLRGVAHAGARGDESASVVAFDLQATQVRIASHIALAPERTEAASSRLRTLLQRERPAERIFSPEIAQLHGGAIVFGPFRGRLPSAGRS